MKRWRERVVGAFHLCPLLAILPRPASAEVCSLDQASGFRNVLSPLRDGGPNWASLKASALNCTSRSVIHWAGLWTVPAARVAGIGENYRIVLSLSEKPAQEASMMDDGTTANPGADEQAQLRYLAPAGEAKTGGAGTHKSCIVCLTRSRRNKLFRGFGGLVWSSRTSLATCYGAPRPYTASPAHIWRARR